MPNESFYLRCPVCGKTEHISKSFSGGMFYSPPDTVLAGYDLSNAEDDKWYATHMKDLLEWMWAHLQDCHQQLEFAESKVLFEVVPEVSTLQEDGQPTTGRQEALAVGYRAGRESLIPYVEEQVQFWQSEMNDIGAIAQQGGEVDEKWHSLVSAHLRKARGALEDDKRETD